MEAFKPNLEVKAAGSKGSGVFSKVFIPNKTVIYEFGGVVMTRNDLNSYTEPQNTIQIGENLYLSKSGGLEDYTNHSCDPNCGLRIVGNRALLVTLYDVQPGHEITFDYSTSSNDTMDSWHMTCGCGYFSCRKVISGFQYLPLERQQYYIKLGIVPSYLTK